jgi:hypothetical protein
VVRALSAWKTLRRGEDSDRVFVDADGKPFDEAALGKLAQTFRDCLKAAGVTPAQRAVRGGVTSRARVSLIVPSIERCELAADGAAAARRCPGSAARASATCVGRVTGHGGEGGRQYGGTHEHGTH